MYVVSGFGRPASDRGPASVQGFPAVALAPSRWRRLRRPALVAAAAVGGLVVGMAAVKLLSPHVTAAVPAFQRVTFGRGYVDSARFGPEGQVIYTASWEGRPVELTALMDRLAPA